MTRTVGILLSGCGHRDGAEIHESVCTLLALDKAGVDVIGIAPNLNQTNVTNHLNGSPMNEKRNIMIEAGRIMRGNVRPIKDVIIDDFNALILPGGFGAALNLCNYGTVGRNCEVDGDVRDLIIGSIHAGRPIGAICISPVVVARVLQGSGINATLTVGNDPNVAADIEAMGATHKPCRVDDIVVDGKNKIVTTPAYMLATRISEVDAGIGKLVRELIHLI